MIDAEILEGIFRRLDDYLRQLYQLAALRRKELVSDLIQIGAAKYYLQVAIESCLDVANHIIARQGFRAPESYADTFTVLAENGVIPQDFLSTAHKMARMRNRLVHLYWEVDADIVYETLQKNLNDFERFKTFIDNFLQTLE